jgi:hypothetical protein
VLVGGFVNIFFLFFSYVYYSRLDTSYIFWQRLLARHAIPDLDVPRKRYIETPNIRIYTSYETIYYAESYTRDKPFYFEKPGLLTKWFTTLFN